jgi:hypothetical protein
LEREREVGKQLDLTVEGWTNIGSYLQSRDVGLKQTSGPQNRFDESSKRVNVFSNVLTSFKPAHYYLDKNFDFI